MDDPPWTELCLVCGNCDGEEYHDVHGNPLYVVCERCGCESGVDDHSPAALRRSRERWLASDRAADLRQDQLADDIARVPLRFVSTKRLWHR